MSMFDMFLESQEMGFDSDYGYDAEIEEAVDEHLNSAVVRECYEDNPFEACLRIANECTQNHYNIINTMAMSELNYLRENGEIMTEAESGKEKINIIQNLKKAVVIFIEKIQGIVNSIFDKIDEKRMDQEKWIKKVADKAKEADGAKIKGKFYTYTNLDDVSVYNDTFGPKLDSSSFNITGTEPRRRETKQFKISDYTKAIYKKVTGGDSVKNDSQFKEWLHKHFRNDGADPAKEKVFSWAECKDKVSNAASVKAKVKKAYEAVKKTARELDKEIFLAEKRVKGQKGTTKVNKAYFSMLSEKVHTCTRLATYVFRAQTSAIMEEMNMYKKMVNAAAKAKGSEDEATSESAWYYGGAQII